ncbi:MAG: replication protein, partial [Candidatus Brocadiales bacterium]|nr:replication protein [Candidatus Bathyanammoxibius amoris]
MVKKKEPGANPQTENGFLRVANELAEAFCFVNLYPYESRVLWYVLRKTFGWSKKTDRIPLSQFSKGAGLDRRLVHRALKQLREKGLIVITKDDKNHISYGLEKDYTKWRVSSAKMTVIGKDDGVSSKKMTDLSSPKTPSIDNISKDTVSKDILSGKPDSVSLEIIDYLNKKLDTHY